MQVTVEKKGDLERQMNITVPAAEIEKLYDERITTLSKTVNVDGFRKGNVPAKVVKERFGEQIMNELTRDVIGKSMDDAFKQEKIRPATQPHVHNSDMVKIGEDYEYHIHFEVFPEITPTKYSGMKLTKPVAEPKSSQVKEIMDRITASAQTFAAKDGKAAEGDRVTIDAQGYLAKDNSAIEGSKLEGHKVVMGSGSLIPGFEENMMGLKKGDEKDFEVTFPTPYHSKELEGAKARFEIKVLEVEAPEKGEMTDDMAKNFGAENVKDLEAKIKEQIESDINNAAEMQLKKDMFDQLCKANDFAVPGAMVDGEFNQLWQAQMQELQQRGLGVEALGKNADEVKVEFKTLAERRVRLGLLLSEIAKAEKIEVETKDVDAEIERIAAGYGEQAEQVKAYYAQPQNRVQIEGPLFEKKVVEWIISNGKVTEKKMDADELLKGEAA